MCAFLSGIHQHLQNRKKKQKTKPKLITILLHRQNKSTHWSVMLPRDTFTLTAAAIWGQGVAVDRTGTVEAARRVVTAVGTNMASSWKCTLIYV